MRDRALLGQALFNRPLAIHPDRLEIILAAMAPELGIAQLFREDGSQRRLEVDPLSPFSQPGATPSAEAGYDVAEGVALIEVKGTLVQRTHTLRPFSGMTGYDGIRQNYLAALEDPDVEHIVFDIDSGGGDVAGCFDLVDTVFDGRRLKPSTAVLAENAYSAAYAIASACDDIVVPRTGGTGSVGVIYTHVDNCGALKQAGLTVTLITDGDFKADGSDMIPLSDRAYRKLKADVQEVGALFRETVARNRDMPVKRVKDTQAGTFLGRQGVDIGFADAVMAPDAAIRRIIQSLG